MNKYLLTLSFLLLLLIVGCSTNNVDNEPENTIADGNVTDEEVEMMEEEWCNHNEGKDFAKDQCGEYWDK